MKEQLRVRSFAVSSSRVLSYATPSDWYPGNVHWDLVFAYEVNVRGPIKKPPWWNELRFLARSELAKRRVRLERRLHERPQAGRVGRTLRRRGLYFGRTRPRRSMRSQKLAAPLVAILLLVSFLSLVSPAHAETQPPVDVKIGAYVLNIYNFNVGQGTFSADFYLWFSWMGTFPTTAHRPRRPFPAASSS